MMYAYSIISYFHVEVTKCVIKKARLYVLSLVTASCILTIHSVLFVKCALGLYDDSIRDALPVQTDSSSDESSSDDEKIILDTMPVHQPVVNTVLSFCSYGIDVGTIVNVKKIASQTFSFKEISKAHTLLYNLCKNDIVGEKRNRRKKDTCISDVLA